MPKPAPGLGLIWLSFGVGLFGWASSRGTPGGEDMKNSAQGVFGIA